ncbi:hypothetical protein CCAL9344_08905 [Campylobacter sp. RM9344]|uniref:Uncharacterized protein n=1 Tax=Campylobacter californiensis TaxID=1032243 RepID=A0AAW3ZWQ7_9BACT|nr:MULTISPECIES: hypothetical protein [unclassified Campylobacter]MBE2985330.1 hypothetical protein [Campylobacter sp. RM6883]MBE2995863.1 hypothetical protein [Campylobacter sp. RM6913]MBE3030294.1 hypothetical protein [Campylobacter sp. RM9344]MBE3608746.1 hypothetical protein [Campylobacter sp. RM9337]QCD51247.1 hypothetical protein CCAL_1362 [Campylobacter sp. RM6914]
MLEHVDYEFIKNEQRQNEISRYCDEYEEKVITLLETISRKLKALREEYEPIIGFGNCDEIDGYVWDNRF